MLEQRPGEPDRWFDLLTRFTLMGPRRSLLGCYNAVREQEGKGPADRVPGAWVDAAKEWEWRERAVALDREQRAQDAAEYEETRREVKTRRVEALRSHLDKLIEAMEQLQPGDAGWRDVGHGLRVVISELRKEFDDDPPKRHMIELDTIIKSLPPELQKLLEKSLRSA